MSQCGKTRTSVLVAPSRNSCTSLNLSLTDKLPLEDELFDKGLALFQLMASTYLLVVVGSYEVLHGIRSNAAGVNRLSFVAVVLHTAHSARTVVELFDSTAFGGRCEALYWLGVWCYAFGNIMLYTMVWARQRKFYVDPLLKQSTSAIARTCSSTLIVGIDLSLVAIAVAFKDGFCVIATKKGCITVWDQSRPVIHVCTTVFMSLCFSSQSILLFLLMHPIVTITRQGFCLRFRKTDKDFHELYRRLCLCSGVCLLTSFSMALAVLLDAMRVVCSYWVNLIGLDLLVNNIAVICTFRDWKKRLFPMLQSNDSNHPPAPAAT